MIKIICVGKIKDNNLSKLIEKYLLRIQPFSKIKIVEIPDLSEKSKESENFIVIDKESEKIIEQLESKCYNILLDLQGRQIDSIDLANKIREINTYSSSDINFIIGGSLGVNDKLRNLVDYRLKISDMTFPHQLVRLIVLEQIYRAYKINNNQNYHK
ncbi:MAG: 23S rRNA (pseudouridine(1915)-N(3))-methyltransferase RlmH [Erysipelotrichaceae bacterium]